MVEAIELDKEEIPMENEREIPRCEFVPMCMLTGRFRMPPSFVCTFNPFLNGKVTRAPDQYQNADVPVDTTRRLCYVR